MRQSILHERTYDRTRGRHVYRSRAITYTIVGGCFVLSLVWFLFVSRYWSTTRLDIQGLKELRRGEVETATYDILDHSAWKPWDQRNLFFIDEEKLANDLRRRLFVESVKVKKLYPNILRLIILERQRKIIYAIENQFLNVDLQGIILGNEISRATYIRDRIAKKSFADAAHPVIIAQTSDPAVTSTANTVATTTGQQLADARIIQRWLDTYQTLLAASLRFHILTVAHPTSRSFQVILDAGYALVMDFQTPLQIQIETYKKFIQTKPKDLRVNEYIDVRMPGKLYLK